MRADRKPLGRKQLLGELLVHAGGAGQHTGADVGHTGEFEQTLDRAVLAVRTVQYRENHVDGGQDVTGAGRQRHQLAAAPRIRGQGQLGAGFGGHLRQLPVADRQGIRVAVGEHPRTFRGDADRDDLEALPVQIAQDAAGGDARDGVLVATPAEDDGDAHAVPAGSHNLERLPVQRGPGWAAGRQLGFHSGLVLRPSSSAIASSTESPLWQTRCTASVSGISTS